MTNMVNAYHEQWISRSEQIVQALASVPTVKTYDSDGCTATFRRLIERYPSYTDFLAAKPNGEVFCTSASADEHIDTFSVAERGWFQHSKETESFVVADVLIGEASGKSALFFGAPVYDDEGTLVAIVGAGLDMSILTHFAAQAELPTGSIITILDETGVIMARYPETDGVIGMQLSDDPLVQRIRQEHGQGTIELTGVDSTKRLYAFAPIETEAIYGQLYITIGIPHNVAFAKVRGLMVQMIGLATLVGLLAIGIALLFGHMAILTPVRRVAKGTEQLSAGNLATQVIVDKGAKEFRQLADSFNTMSKTLQQHEQTLREAETRYRNLVEQIPSIIYMIRLNDGALTYISPRIEALVGLPADAVIGNMETWIPAIYAEDRQKVQESITHSRETSEPVLIEYRLQRQDGGIVWVRSEGVVMYDAKTDEQLLLGTLSNITEQKDAEEVIREQEEVMQELSTPLLHIGDMIMLMPVVGTLDSRRAQQMMEILLKGVEQNRTKVVILDITGVAIVDSQVANAIIQTEHAVRLLGARVILTGIRPEVAQAMVGLGVDLGDVMTHSTLQSGITAVMEQRKARKQYF